VRQGRKLRYEPDQPAPPCVSVAAILSPGFPAVPGGVRDHTARLVTHWEAAGHAVVTAGDLGTAPDQLARDWHRHGVRSALIQYVPFLYGRRGLSPYPERLARAARATGIRVALFVHEPWVPPTRLPWLILSPLQRRQLRRLVRHASAVATPVPAWRALLGGATVLSYVGSTLGDPAAPSAGPPLSAPAVFSITAAGLNVEWIAAAARAIGAPSGLVVVGPDARGAEHGDPSWDWRGILPAADVLDTLGRAPLVLAPYIDGATGRRGSLLTALSAGARVVTTRGHLYDPVFDTGPATVTNTRDEFIAAARRVWSEPDSVAARTRRLAWYREHFDARRLDDRLLRLVTGDAA